jgi:hypothetical protein
LVYLIIIIKTIIYGISHDGLPTAKPALDSRFARVRRCKTAISGVGIILAALTGIFQ